MEKRTAKTLITLMLTAFIFTVFVCADAQFADGDGTEANPWQVATAEHLNNVRNYLGEEHNDKFFIQTANIDLNVAPYNQEQGWVPIGHITFQLSDHDPPRPTENVQHFPFTGNYNGNGHTIDGLFINRDDDRLSVDTLLYQGLFGYTDGTVISNVSLTNVNVRGHSLEPRSDERTGALVGQHLNSIIDNCFSSGAVRGGAFVGGLVGRNLNGQILNSHSSCNITGIRLIGGLVGQNDGFVKNSYYNYNAVQINEENYVTTGALHAEQYNQWLNNERELEINDYFDRQNDNYLITSVADLKNLLAFSQFEEYSYLLTDNLDLGNDNGFFIPYFRGTFNGGNHTVSNLDIDIDFNNDIAFFGMIRNGNISNIHLADVNITGRANIGTLAGLIITTTVINCSSQGTLVGTSNQIGGLIGYANLESRVENCSSSCRVTGISRVGGLVGHNDNGSIITNCHSIERVTGTGSNIGGLAGQNSSGSEIRLSYSTSIVDGGDANTGRYIGGFIGRNRDEDSIIIDCYSTGNVTGFDRIGGFAGLNREGFSVIANSYSTGNVSAQDLCAGGFVGQNRQGIIRNSHSTGNVHGARYKGGFAGDHRDAGSIIMNCYSTGSITEGGIYRGGFIGCLIYNPTVINCYWNRETSGYDAASHNRAEGRTTAQMTYRPDLYNDFPHHHNQTYVDWGISDERFNDDIWHADTDYIYDEDPGNIRPGINNGYPVLFYQVVPDLLDAPEVTIEKTVIENIVYITLNWEAVENANSYRIYSTVDAPTEDWGEPADIVGETSYQSEIGEDEPIRFFKVTASTDEP